MLCNLGYKTIKSFECLNACLSNYFNFYNMPINGKDIFFLGDGFHIKYTNKDKMAIGANTHEANFNFLDKFQIKYTNGNKYKEKDAMYFMEEQTNLDNTLCITVFTEYLMYNPIFKQLKSSAHYINILGLNVADNKVYISDGFVPTYNPSIFEGWVELSPILEAWKRMQYEYLTFDFSGITKEKIVKIKEGSKNAFVSGVLEYLNVNEKGEGIVGKRAVRGLFSDLKKIFMDDNVNLKNLTLDINFQLKIYGHLASKRFILQAIREYTCAKKLQDEYEQIINEWNLICIMLVKIGASRNRKTITRLFNRVNQVCDREEDILRNILEEIS